MEKHLGYSFIYPKIAKVLKNEPNTPKVNFVTGKVAENVVLDAERKSNIFVEQMKDISISMVFPPSDKSQIQIDKIMNDVKGKLSWVSAKVGSNPLLMSVTAIMMDSYFISYKAEERAMWYFHTLSLMIGETGNLNPLLENIGVKKDVGTSVTTHYGLLQQSWAHWKFSIDYFHSSNEGKYITKTGVLAAVAQYLVVPLETLSNPVYERGPSYLPIFQLVPILGAMLYHKHATERSFKYKDGEGWMPKYTPYIDSVNWAYLITTFPHLTKNYYGGRQAIVSMIHINGHGWLGEKSLGAHLYRIPLDVKTLGALMDDSELRKTISVISDAFMPLTKVSRLEGDVMDGDPPKKNVSPYNKLPSLVNKNSFWLVTNVAKTVSKKTPTAMTMLEGLEAHMPKDYPVTQIPKVAMKKGQYYKDPTRKPTHYGIDLSLNTGTNIYAPASAYVKQVSHSPYTKGGLSLKLYFDKGKTGFSAFICHLSKIFVKNGEYVEQGTLIAKSGETGTDCRGAHLHVSEYHNNKSIDPLNNEETPININHFW